MVIFSFPAIQVSTTGLATLAEQQSQTTLLTNIDAGTPAALGQALMAASTPVVIASNQSAVPISAASLPLPTGAATEATLAAASAKLPATLGQKADAASLAVSISTEGTAQLGAVAEAAPASDTASSGLNGRLQRIAQRLTSLIALLPISLGQKISANSLAVTLASDQSTLPVTISDITSSGSISTQNLVPAGAATANSAVLSGTLVGVSTGLVQVTGTYTGALSLQVTVDGSTWVTIGGTPFLNVNTGALSATIASAAIGVFQFEVAAVLQYRITALGAVTGTATISLRNSTATSLVGINNSLPAGTNIIGALSANQSSNVSQINGVTPLMGNGVTGTGSLRVTIASDNTAHTVNAAQSGTWTVQPGNTANTTAWLITQRGRSRANTPAINNYASVNVTSAAYVQLVASTTSAINEIEIFDSSGVALYLATGAAASESDQIIIFPGGNARVPLTIAAGTRVSIKAVSTSAISGSIYINFYT